MIYLLNIVLFELLFYNAYIDEESRPIETLDDSAILLEMLRERLSPNSDGRLN